MYNYKTYYPLKDISSGEYWRLFISNGVVGLETSNTTEFRSLVLKDVTGLDIWEVGVDNGMLFMSSVSASNSTDAYIIDNSSCDIYKLVVDSGIFGVESYTPKPTMFTILRDVKNTVLYYVKNVCLNNYIESNFFNLIQTTTNKFSLDVSDDTIPMPNNRGRGLCPFDTYYGIFGECTVYSGITVYTATDIVDKSKYTVDFINANVLTKEDIDVASIYSQWYYVSVVEEWPEGDIPNLPLVVLSPKQVITKGFQLGGGKKPIFDYVVYVFATSASELDDILGSIYEGLYLKSVQLYSFNNGDMFNVDGTFNYDFDCSTVFNPSVLYFEDVSIKYTRLQLYDSFDINMYRAQINFTITAYIEPM